MRNHFVRRSCTIPMVRLNVSRKKRRGRSSNLRYCTSSSLNAEVDEPEQQYDGISESVCKSKNKVS